MARLIIATRKSPLALIQSESVAARLREVFGVETELLRMVTTGDRQAEWSLEGKGGKGLFTSELEQAVLRRDADVAVHSTKDLPGDMQPGLEIAGYLTREDARDILVLREGVEKPSLIATGSPRRRLQVQALFPEARFTEIRGNVDTRLRKVAEQGVADATVLASAGLRRLGIQSWPGLRFRALEFHEMVPAVGQAAIAVQCRAGEGAALSAAFDERTRACVTLERAFQARLGAGCHTAVAIHATPASVHFYHESVGRRELVLNTQDLAKPSETAARILRELGLGT